MMLPRVQWGDDLGSPEQEDGGHLRLGHPDPGREYQGEEAEVPEEVLGGDHLVVGHEDEGLSKEAERNVAGVRAELLADGQQENHLENMYNTRIIGFKEYCLRINWLKIQISLY